MSNQVNKIKSRLGRNSIDRESLGRIGHVSRGMTKRARSLRADHRRNIAQQFGYPEIITLQQHYDMASRNGLGSNLAYGIVNDTWRVPPIVYEGAEDPERRKDNPTQFEQLWDELADRLKLWSRFKGLDAAQRPMRYGGFVFVTSEQNPNVTMMDEATKYGSPEYLIDLRVYHEGQLEIQTAVQDAMSVNYGKPITFQVKTNAPGATNEWENHGYEVHASRVYAVGEGAIDGSFIGTPCNEGCFEDLMDAAKIKGSVAEGTFQNASNKYAFTLGEKATSTQADSMVAEMEDFDDGVSNSMVLANGSVNTIQTSMPTQNRDNWLIAVNAACAHHDKPMTIAIGHQTGERASGEDIKSWNRVIMDRQEGFANSIIKGFIDELIEKFNMPRPAELTIAWRDLNESTAEQKVDLAKKRAETNKICIESRMQPVYSTEYIQTEAGAPVETVIELDDLGEDDEEDSTSSMATK
ncbi:hypothetical protein [Vibrio phage LP.1]|nr:hypothetical protein [Vibrio phage LP.1]